MQAAGLTAYRNWQPLLEDPSIEVLHVATPPHVRGHHQLPAAVAAYVFVSERKAPLTTDAVRKIVGHVGATPLRLRLRTVALNRRNEILAQEMLNEVDKCGYANHIKIAYQRRFGRVDFRDEDALEMVLASRHDHGKDSLGVTERSLEAQLTEKEAALDHLLTKMTGRRQNTDGNRQVVGGTLFLEIGRRQIDGNAIPWKPAARVLDRGPYALSAFFCRWTPRATSYSSTASS